MANNRDGNGSPAPVGPNPESPPESPTPEQAPVYVTVTPEQWADGAALAGFYVNGGIPKLLISGDVGNGILCDIPVPTATDIANMVRAYHGHVTRVAQGYLKAADKEAAKEGKVLTPAERVAAAQNGANAACNGGYSPSRERKDDPVHDEAMHRFEEYVHGLVRSKNPAASREVLDASVKKQWKTNKAGCEAWVEAAKPLILADRQLFVARKGMADESEAIDVVVELTPEQPQS